jgi:hypothetical protein
VLQNTAIGGLVNSLVLLYREYLGLGFFCHKNTKTQSGTKGVGFLATPFLPEKGDLYMEY